MGEDPREEIARLREHLHRLKQVCELHRRLGEDTEFEIRELKRRAEVAREQLTLFHLQYTKLTNQETLRQDLVDLCDAALKSLDKAVTGIIR